MMFFMEKTRSLFLLLLMVSLGVRISSAKSPSVIIIGAGMSGISTAKTLHEAGIDDFLILEATDRVGGRMRKTNFAGSSVELGANWVEGVGGPKLNPIHQFAKEIHLKTFLSNFDNISSNIYKQTGGLYENDIAEKAMDLADSVNTKSQNLSSYLSSKGKEDISILTAQRLFNHVPSTPLDMVIDFSYYDFEMAEPPRVTSLKNTIPNPTFVDFGDDSYFVADPRGYVSVLLYLAKQFLSINKAGEIDDPRVKLNKVVRKIIYSKNGVIVKTEDGSTYKADYAMVTVSIGVLQTHLIRFQPDLPQWKIIAMYEFDMAIYTKIFLKFPYKFWPGGKGSGFFLYAHEKRAYYPFWQHLNKELPGSNILFVTVTDDEAKRIEQQPNEETKEEIMAALRGMFGPNIPNATDILVPRWWSDRFFKGTYSNWPIGVSSKEFDQIRAPVGRVYFTGEHTSESYNGYVHGAYLAGIDSTKMMLKCIKTGSCSS